MCGINGMQSGGSMNVGASQTELWSRDTYLNPYNYCGSSYESSPDTSVVNMSWSWDGNTSGRTIAAVEVIGAYSASTETGTFTGDSHVWQSKEPQVIIIT